jgi:hypothetical protein
MPRNYHTILRSLRKWQSPVVLIHAALLPESLPQTQLEAAPSSAACVSNAEVCQLLFWLPHAVLLFALLFFMFLFEMCDCFKIAVIYSP